MSETPQSTGPTQVPLSKLPESVGAEFHSTPVLITQERINGFAKVTEDEQWIHVDPERAAAESPFGSTIAHGFLTLSLISRFMFSALEVTETTQVINMGLNKVRFLSPVKAGSEVSAVIKIDDVTEAKGALQATLTATIGVPGSEKPACIAQFIFRYYGEVAGQE
ncbi:MaoC family dehydratase [Granulicoccus phenolivorans]|uniref:MaoC family dehydratase n=1 Tax=Granulicoccus phenolivorans TaxID=266854 RepID=UPI0003FB36EE|nr:MaoC family dehydratase [Granulicoccus phenolivorans]